VRICIWGFRANLRQQRPTLQVPYHTIFVGSTGLFCRDIGLFWECLPKVSEHNRDDNAQLIQFPIIQFFEKLNMRRLSAEIKFLENARAHLWCVCVWRIYMIYTYQKYVNICAPPAPAVRVRVCVCVCVCVCLEYAWFTRIKSMRIYMRGLSAEITFFANACAHLRSVCVWRTFVIYTYWKGVYICATSGAAIQFLEKSRALLRCVRVWKTFSPALYACVEKINDLTVQRGEDP